MFALVPLIIVVAVVTVVFFLLSDAAAYITGATLNVDGGMIRPIV